MKNIDKGMIPDSIIALLKVLENAGFEVFIVGGAIRDLLLGKAPNEFDLASNARPKEIESLFDFTKPIGRQFGTMLVRSGDHYCEVTTYRTEGQYSDSRHPDAVEFSDSIESDLMRRDFTMNAMAYNPISNVFIDLFDGQMHLNEQVIYCVGDALERFREDTLRPFRLFRFVAQLGMSVDDATLGALPQLVGDIELPSSERIRHEMDRLLMGDYWLDALNLMNKQGWLSLIGLTIPSEALVVDAQPLMCRWAWLLSGCRDLSVAKQLGFSKKDIRYMSDLIQWDFDGSKLEITAHDLAISSQALMARGYEGIALGNIQSELLDKVRRGEVVNTVDDICGWLDGL